MFLFLFFVCFCLWCLLLLLFLFLVLTFMALLCSITFIMTISLLQHTRRLAVPIVHWQGQHRKQPPSNQIHQASLYDILPPERDAWSARHYNSTVGPAESPWPSRTTNTPFRGRRAVQLMRELTRTTWQQRCRGPQPTATRPNWDLTCGYSGSCLGVPSSSHGPDYRTGRVERAARQPG